jgi:hypothetical protein
MSKFIVRVLAFFAFTTIFYVVSIFLWGNYAPGLLRFNLNHPIGFSGHMHTRLGEVETFEDVDILFLGSSHTYRGFDVRIFRNHGYSVFNLGSSAQTPMQTITLLNRYLDGLNPKLVIYDVYPETLSSDGIESALDILANDENDIHSFNMMMDAGHLTVFNSSIYAYIRDYFELDDSFSEPIITGDDTYIHGGYVHKKITHYKPQELEKRTIELSNEQLAIFELILNKLDQRGVTTLLVYTPISPSSYNRYLNNDQFDSTMSNYATYYNFNEIIGLDDSLHFYDSHHLNQLGVNVFNKKLIEIISNTNY